MNGPLDEHTARLSDRAMDAHERYVHDGSPAAYEQALSLMNGIVARARGGRMAVLPYLLINLSHVHSARFPPATGDHHRPPAVRMPERLRIEFLEPCGDLREAGLVVRRPLRPGRVHAAGTVTDDLGNKGEPDMAGDDDISG
ncbi:hypothetical protein NE236_18575 [Actinoallomurus purpureus]|uniref:hypothetical protein n=1 Tax=Actinoallomurus purpureus TaxID=478114 RepID=UPI002093CD0C|nr:hypothetical protein [Actinoallomurus purpureus]MCO6006996.1 hypothetical protein [Actinoallomurus purpureus]